MKKVILAVLAFLAVTAAYAGNEYVTISGGETRDQVTKQRTLDGVVGYGQNWGAFQFEGRAGIDRTTKTKVNNNFFEGRTKYSFAPLYGFTPWVRGTLGEDYADKSSFSYWAVEPGVSYHFTKDWSAEASIARQQAFRNSVNADQTAYAAGLKYALNSKNAVEFKLTKTVDQVRTNAVELELTHKF